MTIPKFEKNCRLTAVKKPLKSIDLIIALEAQSEISRVSWKYRFLAYNNFHTKLGNKTIYFTIFNCTSYILIRFRVFLLPTLWSSQRSKLYTVSLTCFIKIIYCLEL